MLFAVLDFIKIVLQFGRVVVIENLLKMLDEQLDHDLSHLGGHEPPFPFLDVVPIHDDRKDLYIGGRTTNSLFLQCLDQSCLAVSRRRLSKLLLGHDFLHLKLLSLGHFGQNFSIFPWCWLSIIAPFLVQLQEAIKLHHCANGFELGPCCINLDLRLVEDGRSHLRGHKAFPDQLIKPVLITIQKRLHLLRLAQH